MAFGLTADVKGSMIASGRALPSWHEREKPLEIILPGETLLDPIGQPEAAADSLRRLFAAGATRVSLHLTSTSREHLIEQIEALAAFEA